MRVILGFIFTAIMGGVIAVFSRLVNPDSWSYAFWLQGFLMFWAHLLRRVYPYYLPRKCYRITTLEMRKPWVYKYTGVLLFRKLLRKIFNDAYRKAMLKSYRHQRLVNLYHTMIGAETAHILIFFVEVVGVFVAIVLRHWSIAVWLSVFNVIFNAYPVAVQRYNRLRIERLYKARGKEIDLTVIYRLLHEGY